MKKKPVFSVIAGYREGFNEQTGKGVIATGGTTDGDILDIVIAPLPVPEA